MATEAETNEPMSETVDINDAVNAIENSFEGKQENKSHQPRKGTNSEKDSEVKVETETEAAAKHAMDTSEKTTANKTPYKDITDLTEAHIEEKGNKIQDETVNDKLEEEKREATNGNLKDESVNYSILDAKQSEKGSTNGPTEINTSSIPKGETIEKEEENPEEAIEGKEVETRAGENIMQEVESISTAEPTVMEQNPDTNVLACQETEYDNQNKDDETRRGGDDTNINIGVSQSPLILQETHDHEDVSRTKNKREIGETINHQGSTEENVQTEQTDTDNREFDIEAVEIVKEYHKEMSEEKEALIQEQVESDIGETEIDEVKYAKSHSIETSRINLDGDVGENDCRLKSEDKFDSFDVYKTAKEEEERVPSEDIKESILESSSTTMEETAVKQDEEKIDESKDIPTLIKTTQVEYVQENGTNSSYDDQTNASISLSNGLSQDQQKDNQDEFTSLKIGNEIQTEPKLCETDDTTETSGANSFKDKESIDRDTENSIENQLQQSPSDVYLDSLTTELEVETEGKNPIDEAVKEDISNASIGAPSIFAVEVSRDQVEGINAMDTEDEENVDKSKDIPTLTKTTQADYDDQTDASISLINGLGQDEQKDKQDEFTSLKIGHEMQTEQKLYETHDTIETGSANSSKDMESMERETVNTAENPLQQNSSDVYLDSLNAELEIEAEGEIPITEIVKEDTSNASTEAPSIFTVEVSRDQGEESNAINTKARDIGLATLDEAVNDKLEEEKIEAKNGNLKDENGNYSISDAKQTEKGSTNGPTEINTSKRETNEKEEENLEEAIEEKEVETQAGDNKMQEVESISIAEPTELEQNPDTSVLACQEMEDDNQNVDDETGRGGDDSNINIGVSQSPLILQETHDHEDVSRTKNEREIDETINHQGTTEENIQTEKTNTDDRELDIEAVEIDKEYHKKISEGKVLIQDRFGSDIAEVNNAKGRSIETSILNLDGDVGEKDCQLKSDDKFESFGIYEIAKEEKERMPSEDTEESILESSSTTMEEAAVKEDEENIKESKDIPTLTKTTQVENVQENGTNSSYDDQTNASISLSNGLSQDEQDEFTSLKIGNEIQIEPKLCRTDDTTETSGAYSFKDKESMERDTENSVENQLQQISSDVYLDSLNTELEIETEFTINETDKEDTANASTEVPSNFAVEVSQDQVEGINATDTKDEENIDESKDIQTLTKTTQVEYDDPTDASIGLINGLSQDEQKDKQYDTIETSHTNSFKDEESMERNTVNSVEEQVQHNSLDVFVDSSNAELEIETEGDIPINETVKDVISNASTGAPSIFAVEVSQDQGEESNGIDTKARDIGLATLDETLSSNKALQEKDMHGDHEYKEEKLETKLLQEELEDKSVNKETGTGAEQEFYEASETIEIRETEDFKESVAPERNVEKETLDGPRFHENVTEAEDAHVNEMEKETLKAKKDKECNDEDSKDIVSNISENSNLHESPALIIYDMEGADIQIADDLIQKPEKEEADNVMAQMDIDESLVVEEKIKSTSIDTSVKARTASENECKEKNEIIASSENNKLEEEQLAIQHITVAKQELFNTSNANKMEEDEGFKDKEPIEQNISEKEILEHTEHEKSPLVILEDLETTTEAKGIQDTEFENQGIENEDNGKKIEASVPNNTEAIPSDSILKDDTECLAKRLPEKEEAINIRTEEDNLLVSQLPNEAADSNASLKIDSESEKNRYIGANVEKEKFEDAAIEKENDKPELAQPHVENEVSESDEIIIAKENEIAEKENCSTNVEPIIESEPRNRSCSSITVTKGGHPSEEDRESELAPKTNTETPCDTMDATYASLDKIMLNDSEAAEDKIHSKLDVMHVSENDEEKKEAHSSFQNKELEGETHTEQELYEGSKSSETYENEVFGNKENAENIDPKEDNSEGKESDILSPHAPLVNSDVLAETKDCNHIKPKKQESITIHEANFNKEEENVIVEETNFEPQHVNQHEDTMEEEDTTPEHLSHQMAEKEAIITTDQETGTERKSSNEKGLEEKDISEYKIADKNDNVDEIETEKQYTHIDDEHNLQKGEDIMLIKSTMETEPGNESTDSTHTIDRETHTEKVDNFVIPSLEKNTQNVPEMIEDKIQNSCVELEDSDNNDKEKEEINIISPNKEKVIKPLETANTRKLGYNEINNEEDTQKGEHMHAELAVCLNPAIQISNSVNENDEGQLVQKDDKAYREQGAIGKVEVEDLMTKYVDTEILHDNASQTLSLKAEEKVPSADIQVNAISKNENKDSETKESEAEVDLKGLEVTTKNQTIHGSEIKNQDATDNNETSDVELDAENQDNESIHTRLEAVITSEEVKDVDLVSQDDTKTVQVEENIYCTQEENGEAPVNVEKENKENRDNIASLRKEDFDKYPREELDGNPVDREEENEKLQAEQICLKSCKSCNSSNIHDNESFPEKESVSVEEMNDQKPESFSILVPDDLNATLKSNTEKETMEFNDEKHIRKEEDTMLVESAITEESGNESNMLVSGTDRAGAFEEAIEDELASQNDVQMTHANALNGKEDPLHKNIENDHRVLDEKIISAASEGHENKSSIERNLIVEESAKIATVNQEKDQDEEHIEESEMDQSDGKVEQNESNVKTGIENTGINTALSKDDMIETAHAELLKGGVGVVPVDRVDENNDRLTEQSKMLSNDTARMETDDSFSKISNYWPITYSNEALNVNKMETLKLDEKTESSLQPVHDEDMLQEQSLQEPELNQSEQVKETEQLIGTKASVEVENDNLQEENLPFSQFLMKHILMNESDSVKTSYDDKIVDISKQDNDKQGDGIDMSKEEEVLVPSSSVEKIHHASIVDDGAGFHEKHQENIDVQVDDKCDDSEVTNNQREMLTAELPIPVLEKTQYTNMVEDEAIDENPQEINKVQVAEDCAVKYNRAGNFPMELPISATEQTQHTSIAEDKTINENAEKNTEIQVDDECDAKKNPEFTDNIKETFTMQSPISVIEQTQHTSIPEHKTIEKPRGTDKVQLDDKCDANDDSKVLDDKKEFSAVGLLITVDSTMMEHKFDACIHNEEFMQNDVDTQKNGKPNDNVVAEKLLNIYDPVQAEKSYGVTSDSETNFVKSDEKEENISNTLSEKSISAVKDKEDIHLISTDREIKEDNPNLLMDEQIFEKTLDDTITEKNILHKKEYNALKVENSDIIEEEKGKRMLKNGLEDEIAVAGLQKDQQSNIVVEPEAALKENNLECNQDMHKYEKENEKEQNKFEAPPPSEGKANSEIKPVDIEDNQDIHNQKNNSTEELSMSESQKAQEVDENNTDDDEDENHEVDGHKGNVSIRDQTINVESRDTEVTPTKRKSHGILSGVGSKVKRSIIKVKKAITGKSSHSETQSAK